MLTRWITCDIIGIRDGDKDMNKAYKKRRRLVLVIWEDTCTRDEWVQPEELVKTSLTTVESVGNVKKMSKDSIVLSGMDCGHKLACSQIINRNCIKAAYKLKIDRRII